MVKKLIFSIGFFLTLPVGFIVSAENVRETPVVKVVRENSACVVNISTERILLLRQNPFWGSYGNEFDILFNQFYGVQAQPRALKFQSVGSGVIVAPDGLIVTNAHVVNMASTIIVILNNGASVRGRVVYESPDKDVALIKIEPFERLTSVKLARASDILVGETAVAVGNPLGLENSVTVGVVSGINRQFFFMQGQHVFDGLIQTDAPINPGNSGGALFNLDGDLIGINMAVVQDSQSIGFAIPVEKVRAVMEAYEKIKDNPQALAGLKTPTPLDDMKQVLGGNMFGTDLMAAPSLNVEPQQDAYIIKMDITNFKKDTIDVQVNPGSLTVVCQRSGLEENQEPGSFYKMESFGSVSRSISLPEDAFVQEMMTEVKDNTFIIYIPKKK